MKKTSTKKSEAPLKIIKNKIELADLAYFTGHRSDNSNGYRSDDFTKTHNGKHVLFLGDSFAFGEGLDKEDTWCYKVYSKIKETEPVSGFFNLGLPGSSIGDSIDQFFKYCSLYGNPEEVFFITTELDRDLKYVLPESLDSFNFRMYFYLDQYCKSNNINLYSFSWLKSIGLYSKEPDRYLYKIVDGIRTIRPLWVEQAKRQEQKYNIETLKSFKSFYDYSGKEMLEKVYRFDKKSKTKHKSLWAHDQVHPGTSFHDFYAEFIHSKYKENN
jgi:hypothetical protein